MNAGFSSLTALKAQLLNESLRSDTGYDALILAVGLGVAGKIGAHCNRSLARLEDDFAVTTGGRASWIVPRYPIEEVSAVEVRDAVTEDWLDVTTQLQAYTAASGCLYFDGVLDHAQIRITYTGGYWWNTTEGDPAQVVIGQEQRSGTATVASGARDIAVTFATALAQVPTSVQCNVIKPDAGAADLAVLTVLEDSITTTGFTVRLSASAPAAGYKVSYLATAPVLSEATSATQPAGSTALPEEIRAAWILQCEHVWRRRDKLGLSIARTESDAPAPGLSDLALIPLVESMLAAHVRHCLT